MFCVLGFFGVWVFFFFGGGAGFLNFIYFYLLSFFCLGFFVCFYYKNKSGIKERKNFFYLTTHGYVASDMVKDHSDSERGNPLPPLHGLFPINSMGSSFFFNDKHYNWNR